MNLFGRWCQSVSPSFDWTMPHLEYLRGALDRVTDGSCRRLMIFMPPRSYKSECVTVRYPVFRLEQDPGLSVIMAAHTQHLADRFSRKSRRLAEQRLSLASDRLAVQEWETSAGGTFRAVGVGGGIAGQGGGLILIDDPIRNREEAESEVYRDRVWDWYTDDLATRQEPASAIVLVQTRWHEDDLAGRLLTEMEEGGEQWEVVCLPAEAEEDDPLGRPLGEPLTPGRFGKEWLETQKRLLGRSYYALYQQRPTPLGGDLLAVDKIQHAAPDLTGLRIYQAYDLAISQKATADYTCCATVGVDKDQNGFLLHVWRARCSFNDTLAKMQELAAAWHPVGIGIETVSYQASALEEARRRHMLPFREVKAIGDKVSRAQLLAARIDAGKFHANRQAPWWNDWAAEALFFPAGKHDDQIDATVHALGMAAFQPGRSYFGTLKRGDGPTMHGIPPRDLRW